MATQPRDIPVATALPDYDPPRTKRRRATPEYDDEPERDLGGRPTVWRPEYLGICERLYEKGSTDAEVAEILDVNPLTLHRWSIDNDEFCKIKKVGKEASDERVELTLYQKAMSGDTTAMIFWLKNRRYRTWRDRREVVAEVSVSTPNTIDPRRLDPDQREMLKQLLLAASAPEVDGEFTEAED